VNTPVGARLRSYRLQLFVATWLSYFGFYVVRKVYAVVKLPLKEHFGLDDIQVAIAGVHDEVRATYFAPPPGEVTVIDVRDGAGDGIGPGAEARNE